MKKDILYRPWKELKANQNKKLHHFITRHLYPFSPFYRRLFDKHKINPDSIRTVADLSRVPPISKKDFLSETDAARKSLDFVLQPDEELIKKYLPKQELLKFLGLGLLRGKSYVKGRLGKEYRPIFLTATTGTTHQPISFLYTDHDLENLKVYGKRLMDVFNVAKDGRAVNMFPYAPHLAFWQTVFAGFAADLFILSTGGGRTLGTEGNIRSIAKVKPQFLIGVPSYVYHVLKTAAEEGTKMPFLKNIVLGASRVPKGFKKKVASILMDMGSSGIKVFGTYGFTEARAAWGECPTNIDVSSGYHTYPDKEVFEIIDPETGEVKAEGEDGELVYTSIDSRGSCVFRYRTGDLVRGGIVYSPCSHCGRTVPRISSDIVRASNIREMKLSKIKGSLVNFNNIEYLLDNREEIDEWQIEIKKKDNDPYEVDELILYVSLLGEVNKDSFIRHLNQEATSSIDVSFNRIEILPREEVLKKIEIEVSVKAKKILDRRGER